MGRPHRIFESDTIYYVQNFCRSGLALITPTEAINDIIMGLLLKHAEAYNIKIIAFIFLPHRFGLLLAAPDQNLNEFMCRFQGDLSKALKKYHGYSESTFPERYIDNPVMDDALEEALTEILALPCTEDLVAHPSEWPGVSSWNAHQTGEALVGSWANSEDYWPVRRSHDEDKYTDEDCRQMTAKEYELELTLLESWEDLSDEARREKIEELVRPAVEQRAEIWETCGPRDENGKCVIPGANAIRDCSPKRWLQRHKPARKRGRCMSECAETRRKFKKERKRKEERYTNAACRLRRGISAAYFPAGMIPPGHRFAVGSPAAIRAGENPQDPAELEGSRATG